MSSGFFWWQPKVGASIGIISPKIKMHDTLMFGFLLSFCTKRHQSFLEKWLIPDLRQGKCKSCLRILLCLKARKFSRSKRIMPKGQKSMLEGVLPGQIWESLCIKNNDRNHLQHIDSNQIHKAVITTPQPPTARQKEKRV